MAKSKQRVESWAVTDEFWARVEPLIPVRERSSTQEYARKPGAGRKPKPARIPLAKVRKLDDKAKIVTSRLGSDRLRIAGTAEFNGENRDIVLAETLVERRSTARPNA